MRIFRTVTAAVVAAILGLGVISAAPAGAMTDLPKRIITEEPPGEHQVTYNAFKLKGNVEAYPEGGVLVQKKACRTCKWKVSKKIYTDESGNFKTRIFAPRHGRWKWRVRVNAKDGYATSYGRAWTLFFR